MKLKREILRVLPLLFIILLSVGIFGDIEHLNMQLYQMSMVGLVIIIFHVTRKSLFPYLDLEEHEERAKKNAIGSAIVYAATMMFLAIMIYVSVIQMK